MTLIKKAISRFQSEFLLLTNNDSQLIKKIIRLGLTYLEPKALIGIQTTVKEIEDKKVSGIFCECGVAKGGSAILMASTKKTQRKLNLYDSYETIPPPTEKDGKDAHDRYEVIVTGKSGGMKGQKYYGYEEDLISQVKVSFETLLEKDKNTNVHFIKGYYEDSLNINEPIAFAHIDCDWYSSVMVCLDNIAPNLSIGGVLIIDDYYHYSGCKKAVDEYFQGKEGFAFNRKSRLHISRIA